MFSLSGFQGVMLLPGFAPLSPWSLTAIMGGGTLGLCVCIWLISRAFSQSGRFADGLLVFAWVPTVANTAAHCSNCIDGHLFKHSGACGLIRHGSDILDFIWLDERLA
jgi:hypothetical protein